MQMVYTRHTDHIAIGCKRPITSFGFLLIRLSSILKIKMAKQTGPFYITGTVHETCFYKMQGDYYVRTKSSLTGHRVKNDPAFAKTMKHAVLLGKASTIASLVYRNLPAPQKTLALYRKLTGMAIQFLKEGKAPDEITRLLQERLL